MKRENTEEGGGKKGKGVEKEEKGQISKRRKRWGSGRQRRGGRTMIEIRKSKKAGKARIKGRTSG